MDVFVIMPDWREWLIGVPSVEYLNTDADARVTISRAMGIARDIAFKGYSLSQPFQSA